MFRNNVRRELLRAVFASNVPFAVKLQMAAFVTLFPHVFQGLVAMRETLILHNAAIQAHNDATKVLFERVDVLWRYVVGERKTGYIT